jgi:hypothetical protein
MGFWSAEDEPGQWVCWDFREMRVRPTRYTLHAILLKSWIVEGSLDGRTWTVIDRQMNTDYFNSVGRASFPASSPAEFRFIRLTQTDKNHRYHGGDDGLCLASVEFFGTLFE